MEKKKFQMPSAYTILFIIIALIAILTWFIPAGNYKVNDEGNIIAGSYAQVASNPQGIWDMLMAPIKGMLGIEAEGNIPATPAAIPISFFILMVGGFLGVVNKTGALEAGIASIVKKFKGKEKMLIPVLMTLFALGGSTYGMAEETLPFYSLLIPVMIAVGFDTVVAVAIVLVGSQVGCLASTVNPFATGVASQAVGISMGEGMGLRFLFLVVLTGISIAYVYRYASKIEKDPSKSLVFKTREADLKHFDIASIESQETISKRQKWVNLVFFSSFIIMIVSLIPWDMLNKNFTFFNDVTAGIASIPVLGTVLGKSMTPFGAWYFPEITMLFMFMSIIVALV